MTVPVTEAPAATRRRAADKLRQLATNVEADILTNDYWGSTEHPPHDYPSLYARGVDNGLGGPAGTYAAAMHPGVGAALADWLELEADVIHARSVADGNDEYAVDISGDHALLVARQILGEAS